MREFLIFPDVLSVLRRILATICFCLSVGQARSQTAVSLVSAGAAQGQPVVATARVTVSGAPATVGTVDFLDGSRLLGTVQVSAATNAWASAGGATFRTLLPEGTHSLTAVYHGPYPATIASSGVVPTVVTGLRALDGGLRYAGTSDLSQNHTWDLISDFVLADTTQDGFKDLLALHFDGSQLITASGDSANPGLFANPTFLPAGYLEAEQVIAADLHADGLLDAVVCLKDAGRILVYGAQAPNSFSAPVTLQASVTYPEIAIADFNGDGLPDIAAVGTNGNGGSSLNIWINNPARPGTFPQFPSLVPLSGMQPFDFSVADLNGDGLPDVVVGGQTVPGGLSQVTVGLNQSASPGSAFTSTVQDLGTTFFQMTVGDLNHDGLADVIAGGLNGNLLISLNDASHPGTLLPTQSVAPPAAMSGIPLAGLAIGDIDGDGVADIVAADTGNFFTVFHGNGDGTFAAGAAVVTSPTPLAYNDPVFAWENTAVRVDDLDGDGYGDVVLSEIRQNTVQVYLHAPPQLTPLIQTASDISTTARVFHQGQTIPLTSLENSTSGTMTGTVSFYDSGGGATNNLIGTAPIVNGSATFQFAGAAVGFHDFTSVFPGDSSFAPSQSAILPVVVIAGPAALVALSATPNPALQGETVSLRAAISSNNSNPGVPTGSVTFMDGSVPLGPPVAISGGVAALSVSSLSAGIHNLTAVYAGDATFPSATSNVVAETVLAPAAATLSVAPASGTTITTFHFAVSVAGSAGHTPSGPVALYSGTNLLGSSTLDATGQTVFNVANLLPGSYSITAQYAGDALFPASTSNSVSLTVILQPTTLNLSVAPTPGTTNSVETLTATIGLPPYSGTAPPPTGTIIFYDGASVLGIQPVAGLTSTLRFRFTSAGTHFLSAKFSGDARFDASTTGTVPLEIGVDDFTISATPTPLSIRIEHHAPLTIQLQSIGAFSGPVELSCLNLPPHATCTFAKASLTLLPGGSSSTTVMVDTDDVLYFASSGLLQTHGYGQAHLWRTRLGSVMLLALGLLAATAPGVRRRRIPFLLKAALLFVGSGVLTGCGNKYPAHTPPGTYPLTIQAKGPSVQHTFTGSLVVTP